MVEAIAVLGGAFLLAVLIQQFAVKPYKIPSLSMAPTLVEGQRVFVDRTGLSGALRRGQIVVFHPPSGADRADPVAQCGRPRPLSQACPENTGAPSDRTFVKRVVGLPGDRIALEGGHVVRNGRPVREPYAQACAEAECRLSEITVPPDSFYVLGDNRDGSDDSRYWGPVRNEWLIGRAVATYWPLDRVGGVDLG